jgi:hypothetical protein
MKLYYGLPHDLDFETLLYQFPDREFEKLARSTIPLLFYWREPELAINKIAIALSLPTTLDGSLCFEYPVKSVSRAKPSFTDLMYVSPQIVFGIEAKATEPRYKTVQDWLSAATERSDREAVLSHWLGMITQQAGEIVRENVLRVPYQMVHRLASICSLIAKRHAMIYQVYSFINEEGRQHYRDDLRHLYEAIANPRSLSIWLHEIVLRRTDNYDRLKETIAARGGEAPLLIRRALIDGGLFEVENQRIEPIGKVA